MRFYLLSRRWLAVVLLVLFACACACRAAPGAGVSGREGGPAASASGASVPVEVVAKARLLARPGALLGDRPEVLSVAEGVEALAVREGAGARAESLHELAATVLERAFRRFGREQDGKEASLLFQHAGADLAHEESCASAVRAAVLSGEVARDAAVTYAELYRVQRRLGGDGKGSDAGATDAAHPTNASGCGHDLEQKLADLAPFRPPARVLEAIDQGLEGEGLLASARGSSESANAGPRLMKIEPIPGTEAARVVILLSQSARFHPGDVAVPGMGPPRTYVDLDGVAMGPAEDHAMTGIVTNVRAEPTKTGARVTLSLDGQAFRKVFYLPEPYRVVIDIARHPPGVVATSGRRRVERIVLDPGHGGWDPGAIGPAGLHEKDVTLDIARRVAPVLQREGLTVVLTRDDDRYVPLEERTARANAFGADLFVSIHCNAADNHLRHGVETYVLDTTKDEIASRVAARENATSQAATAEIGSILASLRLADHANHSNHLAELLQRTAMVSLRESYHDVHDGGVHTAGFYVLVGARMPAILFETSYISNANEEARLASADYKQRLADAISNAVRAYREGR